MDAAIAEAAVVLRAEHGIAVDVDERMLKVVEPVKGEPGLTVLRVLGVAQSASPVGGAARSAEAVAAGVWRSPDLYVARWLNGRRWIVGYRLTGGSRLNDYVRTEGRVPTRLETGHWYDSAPDTVSEVFFEAGILLDDPPFPIPIASRPPPPPPPAPPRPGAGPGRTRPEPIAGGGTGRAPRPPKPPPPSRPKAPANRLCPSCRMHKNPSQFVAGSDLCVDCR